MTTIICMAEDPSPAVASLPIAGGGTLEVYEYSSKVGPQLNSISQRRCCELVLPFLTAAQQLLPKYLILVSALLDRWRLDPALFVQFYRHSIENYFDESIRFILKAEEHCKFPQHVRAKREQLMWRLYFDDGEDSINVAAEVTTQVQRGYTISNRCITPS